MTKTAKTVLMYLEGNSARVFYPSQIAKTLELSASAVRNALRDLSDRGAVDFIYSPTRQGDYCYFAIRSNARS